MSRNLLDHELLARSSSGARSAHAAHPSARGAAEAPPEPDLPRVLVVDDDVLTRRMIRGYLAGSYAVLEAASGLEALETLDRVSCDAVVLDVVMPGMSGFSTCQRIKARSSDAFLPVLMLTSLDEPTARHSGFESGADDFLVKPVARHELLLRVGTFVRLRRREHAVRTQLDELRRAQDAKDELVSLLVPTCATRCKA
ncbi:MAG: response regulator [Sandaracinaceae bacterium]|nr:response regulator [Sandaracinaceae bacterium]